MKIRIEWEFSDRVRRAINYRYGYDGPASRETIESTVEHLISADLDLIVDDYDRRPKRKRAQPIAREVE